MRGLVAVVVGVLGLVACSTPLADIGRSGAAASLGLPLVQDGGSTALAMFAAGGGTLRLRGGVQGYGKLPNAPAKSTQSKREKRVERGHVLKMKKTGGAGRKGRVAKRQEEKAKREAVHSPWQAKRLAEQSEKRKERKTERIQSGRKVDIPAPGPPRRGGGAQPQQERGADRPGANEQPFEALDEHGKKMSLDPARVMRMPGATVPPRHEHGAGATELQEVSRGAGLRPEYDADGNIRQACRIPPRSACRLSCPARALLCRAFGAMDLYHCPEITLARIEHGRADCALSGWVIPGTASRQVDRHAQQGGAGGAQTDAERGAGRREAEARANRGAAL